MRIFLSRLLRNIKYLIFGFKCEDCFHYNIGDGYEDINICKDCKNFKNVINDN